MTFWQFARLVALVALLTAITSTVVMRRATGAEPHVHGVTVPDWYDATCCSNRDCHPVESDVDDVDEVAPGVWRYRPTGQTFRGAQVHSSRDGHFHVCISPTGAAYCIYIVSGA